MSLVEKIVTCIVCRSKYNANMKCGCPICYKEMYPKNGSEAIDGDRK